MPNEVEWSNKDGQDFYKVIPKAILDTLYAEGGMLSCLNGKISTSFFALTNQHTVLEVGAGFGRVIDTLEKKGFKEENITAVERDLQFVEILQQRFPKLKIFAGSIQDFPSDVLFDYIGCWYSVFMEFNAEEQKTLLKQLRQLLNPDIGIMIIDVVPLDIPSNATHISGKNVTIEREGIPPIHGYALTLDELHTHAKAVGLAGAIVTYWTSTGRKRTQGIFTHKKNLALVAQIEKLAQVKSEFFSTRHTYYQNKQTAQNSKEMADVLTHNTVKPTIF